MKNTDQVRYVRSPDLVRCRHALFSCLLIFITSAFTQAQIVAEDPKITELKKAAELLEQQKLIVASQLKIAQDEKTMRESMFGATLAPREGEISVSNAKAEVMVITQQQMSLIARSMALNMKDGITEEGRNKRVLLLSGSPGAELIAAARGYLAVKSDIDSLERGIAAAIKGWEGGPRNMADGWLAPPPSVARPMMMGGAGAGDILSSLNPYAAILNTSLSTLALLRVDREFTGVDAPENNEAFLSLLGDAMRREGTFNKISMGWLDSSTESELFSALIKLDQGRVAGKYAAAEIESRVAVANKIIEGFKSRKPVLEKTAVDSEKEKLTSEEKKKAENTKLVETNATIAETRKELLSLEENKKAESAKLDEINAAIAGAKKADPPLEEKKKEQQAKLAEINSSIATAKKQLTALEEKKEAHEAKFLEFDTSIALATKALEDALEEIKYIVDYSDRLNKFFIVVNPHSAKLNPLLSRADAYFTEVAQQKLLGFPLNDLLKAERLKQTPGYILFAQVNFSDGTNLTRRTLLTNSFRAAGAISVSCQILDRDGRHIYSVTDYDYRYYKSNDSSYGDVPTSLRTEVAPKKPSLKPMRRAGPR